MSSLLPSSPESSMRASTAVASYATALLSVAAIACTSATTKPRTLPHPVPQPASASSMPTSWAFRYSAGTYRYTVQSSATIELATDTATHKVPVTTTTSYTLTVTPSANGQLAVSGIADSLVVARGAEIPAPQEDSSQGHSPVPFSATITATGDVLGFQGAQALSCDSAMDLRAAEARELFIGVPQSLSDSSQWDDSTSTTSCRGGVPVTTRALHHYQVAGQFSFDGTPAIQLRRTSTISIAGSGTPEHRTNGTFALNGTGTSSATLYLDPQSGVFLGGSSTSRADIIITTARGQLPFHQEVQEEIHLQH